MEEELKSPKEVLRQKLVSIAKVQIDACLNFKRPRMADIQKNEDLYNNKVRKAIKGRWNMPLPIMPGFLDTLMSKIDERVMINFGYKDLADYKRAKKVTAAWELESSPQFDNWDKVDRACKKQAILCGLGIYKFYAESNPKYSSHLYVPDIYDFIFEPNGGNDIQKHLFVGEKNIFKTKQEIIDGVDSGLYDLKEARKLISSSEANDHKDNEDAYNEKNNRFKSLGLDPVSNNYVGQPIFALNEHYMVYNGTKYYLLFDCRSGACLRCEKLKDVFKSDLYPYVTWQTNEDAFNLLSKALADDIRPVAEAMKEIFNQMLDNIEKRNWNQRIIKPDMFSDISEFNWRPNGLIKLKAGESRSVNDGIYEFKVDDNSSVVINVFSLLENYLGKKTGITSEAQGVSDKDKKVGIYYGEMQQVADRIGLQNKAYTEAQIQLGYLYYWGLKEHLTEGMMVKLIGDKGVEWDEIKKNDLAFTKDPDIFVTNSNSDTDSIKQQRKIEALSSIISNPLLAQRLNPEWTIENVMTAGGWEIEDIKSATDLESNGSKESISEAKQYIEDC